MYNLFSRRYMRLLLSVIISMILVLCCFETAFADRNIKLTLDGKTVECDSPPVIVNDRTLVPLRAVFEAMGAEVGWDNKARTASVKYDDMTVSVTIDSKTAYVNGGKKTLEVPATIKNDRTLVPVRFISEQLGFEVGWEDKSSTVILKTPVKKEIISSKITSVSKALYSETTGTTTVRITADSSMEGNYKMAPVRAADNERFFIDFSGYLREDSVSSEMKVSASESLVKQVRTGQKDDTTVRVVFDIKEASDDPEITLSSDGKTMTVELAKYSKTSVGDGETAEDRDVKEDDDVNTDDTSEKKPTTIEEYREKMLEDGKLIVCIDPGHGKSTAGKRSPDESFREWEFNRDVAYRIKEILDKRGIVTVMTVEEEDKTDPSLKSRVTIANKSEADIFVSIHANAMTNDWNDARGWEVYIYKFGGFAEKLAKEIKTANKDNGLTIRGTKTANFYVIKNTVMPAVLIEHGFFTNKEEVELLKSDEMRETFAECDAKGICSFLGVEW